MKNVFNTEIRHKITEANINFYATPFVHPKRKMKEHDFIYMLDGKWIIGQNSEEYSLKKDSLLILSANNSHYGVIPCDEGSKTMYFHLSCEEGDGFFENGEQGIDTLIDASLNSNIKKYFYEIVNAKISGDDIKANLFFDILLHEIKLIQNNDFGKIGEEIKKIIHRNPEKFFSNKELSEKLNVSVKTAENKFKALFGITIHQYMLNHKIELAISYFKNFPEMPIKEISYNLGFYDEYHFSKQFKKIIGVSPSEYKNRI